MNFVRFPVNSVLQTVSGGCFWILFVQKIFPYNENYVFIWFIFILILLLLAWQKCSLEYLFSNVSLKDINYRKKCIIRKLSWNSEKPSSRPVVFCNGIRCSWKFREIHAPLHAFSFFAKAEDWTTVTLLKIDSSTGDLLSILWNSQGNLFLKDCFWK